nr:GNAT family N-acetyltransferase [Limibaculum sp. NKW23]
MRHRVFVEEQRVPKALEIDGEDPSCRHWLVFLGGAPVATARVRLADGRAKIQRVAVAAEARGTGIGAALMQAILAELAADPAVSEAWLESQTHALAFYERLGFVAEGPEFLDAGLPHRRMRRALR